MLNTLVVVNVYPLCPVRLCRWVNYLFTMTFHSKTYFFALNFSDWARLSLYSSLTPSTHHSTAAAAASPSHSTDFGKCYVAASFLYLCGLPRNRWLPALSTAGCTSWTGSAITSLAYLHRTRCTCVVLPLRDYRSCLSSYPILQRHKENKIVDVEIWRFVRAASRASTPTPPSSPLCSALPAFPCPCEMLLRPAAR